ncbi:MAG TPA: peptidoglycan-associated lipoprotein Pal [Gammaproteobacteria bacterium]|jgi:peptidoglycan-associated lipoprotein|nr:peptidoglycan-associated lipoprotein Pal [Gammaproteobacteria bacterium]
MKNVLWMVLVATAFSVTACSKSSTRDGGSTSNLATSGSSDASTSGQGGGGGISVSELSAEQARLMQQLVVYFDYDQAEIKPEFNALLAAHGQYLAKNPAVMLRLEGHTDERGSREYNIGLGERRAQSVRRALLLQGASANQITTVSYGEERPAATGSNEEAWRLNRRVELVYPR